MQLETFGIYFSAKQGAELIDFYFYFLEMRKLKIFQHTPTRWHVLLPTIFLLLWIASNLASSKVKRKNTLSIYLYSNQSSIEKERSVCLLPMAQLDLTIQLFQILERKDMSSWNLKMYQPILVWQISELVFNG